MARLPLFGETGCLIEKMTYRSIGLGASLGPALCAKPASFIGLTIGLRPSNGKAEL
jgi:hypothetical protein